MVDFTPARTFRRADAFIPNGSQRARTVVAALDRVADTAVGIVRQDAADDEADKQAAHRIEMERLERERAAKIADRAGAFAEFRAGLDQYANEARVGPDAKPGAQGHGDKVAAEVERRLAEFRETLGSDPEVRARFEPLLRGEAAGTIGRERAWELAQFGQYQGENFKKFRDSQGIQLQKAPTAENFKVALAQTQMLAEGMSVSGNVRDALIDDAGTYYARTALDAQLAGGNSAGVRAIINEGLFDKYLDPKLRETYLRGADLVDQRAAAEAEAAQAEQLKAAREAVATVKQLIAQGAQPTPAQMKAVEAAGGILPDSEKVELAGLAIGVDVARRTQGWSAARLKSFENGLQAKVSAGTASQWEQMALQHVRSRYENAAESEGEANREFVATPQGRLSFVNQLATGPDRAAAFDSAERAQKGLGHVMLLPTKAARQMAIEGREIRKAQPDLVPADKAQLAFRATLGRVSGLLGDEFDDKLAVAMDLYAQSASRRGRTKDNFDAAGFGDMVQLAMGATWRDGVRHGGIGRVNGGAVLLPDQSTEASFSRSIARHDFSGAIDDQKRAVPKSWIVSNMVPVYQRDDESGRAVYYFVDANGRYLQHKDGGPYALFVK